MSSMANGSPNARRSRGERAWWSALALVSVGVSGAAVVGCGGGDEAGRDGAVSADAAVDPTVDAGPVVARDAARADTGPEVPPEGVVSDEVHVDHFGWRPNDTKYVVLRGHADETVEVRRISDGSVALSVTATAAGTDEDSGDEVAVADISALTEPADYYVALPASGLRSYRFSIAESVFDIAGLAAAKSYYFQRCNHDRALPYASDALGGYGRGGQWVDGVCHAGDTALGPGPDSANDGTLDLHGGWHDAGDYQKTLWERGVSSLLFGYEMNPGVWTDGQLAIPESGNGTPDLLDEVAWELDFYVRMQRPDGHFLTSVKGHEATVTSPPSASDEARVYFDTTSPSDAEWSGGGVTPFTATGYGVLTLAHAAVVYASVDATRAASYRAAASAGWAWLDTAAPADDGETRLRVAAAAAVMRMDGTASAASRVTSFAWNTWGGLRGGAATPSESVLTTGAWHCLATPSCEAAVGATIREAVADVVVANALAQQSYYGGMFGGPGNGWEYAWGSNRNQSQYGANLMMAVHFGATGGRIDEVVEELAERHLHAMLGLNPLSMVYLTNTAAYGGEHSSFQIYHSWFSVTGSDGDHGNAMYNGLPTGVDEPLYPYYPDDTQTSVNGPAPGIVPGGPNFYYSGGYTIPNRDRPAYAYRDFSVGCEWNGATCNASGWEITEPSLSYQGPFVMLVSFFMSR